MENSIGIKSQRLKLLQLVSFSPWEFAPFSHLTNKLPHDTVRHPGHVVGHLGFCACLPGYSSYHLLDTIQILHVLLNLISKVLNTLADVVGLRTVFRGASLAINPPSFITTTKPYITPFNHDHGPCIVQSGAACES